MSIHQPGHFIALHHSGHHISEVHPQASQALSSISTAFPSRTLSPIQLPQATPPMMSPPTMSPTMMSPSPIAPPTPYMTPKASPPILQQPATFQPQVQPQASMPIPQAQSVRPVVSTQQSAPVSAPRPAAPQTRHSSGLGRFFSDTASGALSSIIATDITNATSGTGVMMVGGGVGTVSAVVEEGKADTEVTGIVQ